MGAICARTVPRSMAGTTGPAMTLRGQGLPTLGFWPAFNIEPTLGLTRGVLVPGLAMTLMGQYRHPNALT
jgi:hypothetical protein